MIRFPPDTLDRPPDEGARRIAARLLEEAGAALARVGDAGDVEALHDFRVNLRRLSSSLMAYRPYLPARAANRAVTRIRDLARRTNRARDYEVQIEWLRARRERLVPAQRYALGRVLRDLDAAKARAYAGVLDGIPERFSDLRSGLLRKLESHRARTRPDDVSGVSSFAAVSGDLIEEHSQRLRDKLALLHSPGDQQHAHQARIQAKRLRYLIEPLSPHVEGGRQALRQLKGLQDLLGELNDLALLERTLAASLERAEIEHAHGLVEAARSGSADLERRSRRRTHESGLVTLLRLVEERKRELFSDLAAKWLGDQGATEWLEFEALAQRLAAPRERG